MGQGTIQRLGVGLILLCVASHGFPLMEDLPVGGNGLDAMLPSVYVMSSNALLQNKYNLPVMNLALSPPTHAYQRPLVQELSLPVHNFQRIPVTELRPPTVEYQPPVVKFNWKKRVDVFPDPASPVKVPTGPKGLTSKAVKSKTAPVVGVDSPPQWWVSVPMVDRHLQLPTENFDRSG